MSGQEAPDLFGLLKGLDGYLSQKAASARRKSAANALRNAKNGTELRGVDLAALAAERLEYLRDEVRKVIAHARKGGAL